MEKLDNQPCPVCHKNTMMLTENQIEVPYFNKLFVFSMTCHSCKYHKADVEAVEEKEPCKFEFEIESEKDMNVRVIKSSQATVKLPHITTIESGPASNGYITNIEGVLKRVKSIIESVKDDEEEPDAKKKAKRLLKKLNKVMWGQEKLKITIEDPSGNSAIISDKAKRTVLKTIKSKELA